MIYTFPKSYCYCFMHWSLWVVYIGIHNGIWTNQNWYCIKHINYFYLMKHGFSLSLLRKHRRNCHVGNDIEGKILDKLYTMFSHNPNKIYYYHKIIINSSLLKKFVFQCANWVVSHNGRKITEKMIMTYQNATFQWTAIWNIFISFLGGLLKSSLY